MLLTQYKRRFITSDEIQRIEEGDCWYIDSEAGETVLMMIAAVTCDACYLESCSTKGYQFVRMEMDELQSLLYDPIPDRVCYH